MQNKYLLQVYKENDIINMPFVDTLILKVCWNRSKKVGIAKQFMKENTTYVWQSLLTTIL